MNQNYIKKILLSLLGAVVAIPSVATGFYIAYQLITKLGNS